MKQEPWVEEWENSEVYKRITTTEMFAINHGFEEWKKPTYKQKRIIKVGKKYYQFADVK